MPQPTPIAEIASYHAHIYYDPATTRTQAEQIRQWISERFQVRIGRWHDVRVGPHDQAMFQIAFENQVFPTLVPWLMLNHGELSVLIHPNTTNPRLDHTGNALWLGKRLAVHSDILPEAEEAEGAGPANTEPRLSA